MASRVNISSVIIHDNPANFTDPYKFEITFECYENLSDDLEWSLTYVGSAENSTYDQVLDSILVGPVPEGRHKFMFETDPPDVSKIPPAEIVGVTVILLSCAFKGQEFIKIGYFVRVEYEDEQLIENPPETPVIEKLRRNILFGEPRVTRFHIKWDDQQQEEEGAGEQQKEQDDAVINGEDEMITESQHNPDVVEFSDTPADSSYMNNSGIVVGSQTDMFAEENIGSQASESKLDLAADGQTQPSIVSLGSTGVVDPLTDATNRS